MYYVINYRSNAFLSVNVMEKNYCLLFNYNCYTCYSVHCTVYRFIFHRIFHLRNGVKDSH